MTIDDSIVFGLIMGIVFWAAAMGGIAILGAWVLVLFGATVPETGEPGIRGVKFAPGAAAAVAGPAEEGGQIGEWETNRADRVA